MRRSWGSPVFNARINRGFLQNFYLVVKNTIDFCVHKSVVSRFFAWVFPKLSELVNIVFISVVSMFIHAFHRTYKLLQLLLLNTLLLIAGD